MKKLSIIGIACGISIFIIPGNIQAQTLEDLLNSKTAQKVLNVVKEATALKSEDLEGTWQYEGAACQFKSDDLLQKAGGIALAGEMENKLESAYKKAGIKEGNFSYTFCSDSTFSCQMGKKKLNGTYSYDSSSQTLNLNYYGLLNSEVQLSRNSDGIALLFNADRLLKLVTLLSNYSKSSTLAAIGKLAEQYDGMLLGFDMKK